MKPTPAQAALRTLREAVEGEWGSGAYATDLAILRAALTAAAEVGDTDDIERAFEAGSKHGWESVKAATIERCARVVDDFANELHTEREQRAAEKIAAAIRALKDK